MSLVIYCSPGLQSPSFEDLHYAESGTVTCCRHGPRGTVKECCELHRLTSSAKHNSLVMITQRLLEIKLRNLNSEAARSERETEKRETEGSCTYESFAIKPCLSQYLETYLENSHSFNPAPCSNSNCHLFQHLTDDWLSNWM